MDLTCVQNHLSVNDARC